MTCKGKDVRPASRQNIIYWAFLLPNFLGVLYFALLPMLQVLVRSFQSAISGRWMGFGNYLAVLKNTAFQIAVSNTAQFTLVCVPLLVALSLALAVALRAIPSVGSALRSAYLMPMAVPAASVVLVWKALFHKKGLINGALLALGGSGVDWMGSGAAFWMLVISYLWKNLGYTVVLWMAGLAGIPESVYEAAQVDGANALQGDMLFTLDLDYLVETILTQKQNMEKQRLSIQDAWSQNAASQQRRANAQAQAEENYNSAVSQAETALERAERNLERAKTALENYYNGITEEEALISECERPTNRKRSVSGWRICGNTSPKPTVSPGFRSEF